jgi:hypothetical protein
MRWAKERPFLAAIILLCALRVVAFLWSGVSLENPHGYFSRRGVAMFGAVYVAFLCYMPHSRRQRYGVSALVIVMESLLTIGYLPVLLRLVADETFREVLGTEFLTNLAIREAIIILAFWIPVVGLLAGHYRRG